MTSNNAEFDQYAESYDAALAQGLSISGEGKDFFAENRVAWLERCLRELNQKPRSVLDYGCGTGSSTPYLLGLSEIESVIGVDVSSKSIAVAKRSYGSERAHFLMIDEYQPSQEVDLAFCNGVFHHIQPGERAAAVNYVYRALRPGGLFAFWENNPLNPGTRYVMSKCPFDEDAITLTHLEAKRLIRSQGFRILKTNFLFIFPRALRWFRRVEPLISQLPLGAQYLVLCRKPE